jgi:hypothetical protein
MAGRKHGVLKNRNEIFLARGLDSRISVESAHEIRFFAHADLLAERPAQVTQQSPILPDGQIKLRRFPPEGDDGVCHWNSLGFVSAEQSALRGAIRLVRVLIPLDVAHHCGMISPTIKLLAR